MTGSLQNRLQENKMFTDIIEVGTGMTEYFYSDRHAYEVVEVTDQKHIKVRELGHRPCGDFYSNQWELYTDESNPIYEMNKRGKYWYYVIPRIDGKKHYSRANVSFGVASYYYDYEF